MVKVISFLALSTLIIAPTSTFASKLWGLETRDVSEPYLFDRELSEAEAAVFAREIQGLFTRQEDLELERRSSQSYCPNCLHEPFKKHEIAERSLDDDLLERNLDDVLYGRDLMETDLFERFYEDDLRIEP